MKAPVGDHEVCSTGVPEFAAPPCRAVTVVVGETTVTEGVFRRLELPRVDVDPSLAVDIRVDVVPRNQFGLFVFKAPGSSAVCGSRPARLAPTVVTCRSPSASCSRRCSLTCHQDEGERWSGAAPAVPTGALSWRRSYHSQ